MSILTKRSVFIVGAGASVDFGLPTGEALTKTIKGLSNFGISNHGSMYGDSELYDAIVSRKLENRSVEAAEWRRAAGFLSRAMDVTPSIDNYLNVHRDDPLTVWIGKCAIVTAIMYGEFNSKLAPHNNAENFSLAWFKDSWLAVLFKILAESDGFEEFLSALSKITFVCFNYDRCIEEFFRVVSQEYFRLRPDDTERVMASLDVIHPYGTIGPISSSNPKELGFGGRVDSYTISKAAQNIQTFTEGSEQSDVDERINVAFEEANTLVSLGFSFGSMNMQKFPRTKIPNVFATAYGESSENRLAIAMELRLLTQVSSVRNIHIKDVKCAELLLDFRKALI